MKNVQKLGLLGSAITAIALSAGAQAQDDKITYNTHVAKILNENCVVCHREGGVGPMQLTNYDQVRPWAPLISYKVAEREMPPYAYDHGVGIQDLKGDWRLSEEEISTVVAWVNSGSPIGDTDIIPPAADLPDPDQWTFEADYGTPDLIIGSVPMDIPANGNDLWSKHMVPTGVNQERCIKAVQVRPRGNAKAVVHHANSEVEVMNEDGEYESFGQLTEYAMGKWGEVMPEGVCRTMPTNSRVSWDIHMFPGGLGAMAPGTIIKDNVVEIGLWFHDEDFIAKTEPYKQDLKLYPLRSGYENGHLIVPPNGYTMTQGFHSFDHPVRIDSFQPHGHLRMNAASLEVFYPETGRTEQISQISKWSATWHHSHIYNPEIAPLLPAGAVLVIKQWYDNTAANPNNPDPDQWVVGGSRTGDEMSHAWIAVTHLDDEGFDQIVLEREENEQRSLAGSD